MPSKEETQLGCFVTEVKESYFYLHKVAILGSDQSGKTSLIRNYMKDVLGYSSVIFSNIPNQPFQFTQYEYTLNNRRKAIQLWDLTKQTIPENVPDALFQGVSGIVLTYNLVDKDSFNQLQQWIDRFDQILKTKKTHNFSSLVVIGTKFDLLVEDKTVRPSKIGVINKKITKIYQDGKGDYKEAVDDEILTEFTTNLSQKYQMKVYNFKTSISFRLDRIKNAFDTLAKSFFEFSFETKDGEKKAKRYLEQREIEPEETLAENDRLFLAIKAIGDNNFLEKQFRKYSENIPTIANAIEDRLWELG